MINKVGHKLLFILLLCYTLTLFVYLFGVVNVLSHRSCVAILLFSALNIAIDYVVLVLGGKFKSKLGTKLVSDIAVIALLYTLMQFFTVVFARNILEPWQYAAFQSFYLILSVASILPKILTSLKQNK